VQSKVDVLGGLPATTAEAAVQAKHRLNLARQIGKMATRIDRQFLATNYPLSRTICMLQTSSCTPACRMGWVAAAMQRSIKLRYYVTMAAGKVAVNRIQLCC